MFARYLFDGVFRGIAILHPGNIAPPSMLSPSAFKDRGPIRCKGRFFQTWMRARCESHRAFRSHTPAAGGRRGPCPKRRLDERRIACRPAACRLAFALSCVLVIEERDGLLVRRHFANEVEVNAAEEFGIACGLAGVIFSRDQASRTRWSMTSRRGWAAAFAQINPTKISENRDIAGARSLKAGTRMTRITRICAGSDKRTIC